MELARIRYGSCFTSPAGLTVESMHCSGLTPCTRVNADTQEVAGVLRDVALAPLALGAVLVTATAPDWQGPASVGLRFLSAAGAPLNGGGAVEFASVVGSDSEFRAFDAAVFAPTATRPYDELFVAVVVGRAIADQNELRLLHGVVCQNE